jgi:RimJ/RimL family protein N-acetyltransferase
MILQPLLENEWIKIEPLKPADLEILFDAASDPLIWEQHPNPDRYKREVFEVYFAGAIASKGAFLVRNAKTNEVIGSSRYYDYNETESAVLIGYTFLVRSHWGTTYNRALKTLMLDHAFLFVNKVHLHIGALNIRSQKAAEKLGAKKIEEKNVAYHGETEQKNFVYEIGKKEWSLMR